MIFACPVAAVIVAPPEMGTEKRHYDTVTLILIVIRSKKIETIVHRHVPWVA